MGPRIQLFPSALIYAADELIMPSIIFTLMVFAGMKYADGKFTNEQAPFGQLSFQLAFTEQRARDMVLSWSANQAFWVTVSLLLGELSCKKKHKGVTDTRLDYAFMLAYGATLIIGVVLRGNACDVAINVASLVTVAVLLDAVEGLGLLAMLRDPKIFLPKLPFIVGLVAVGKFIALAAPIVYIIRPFGSKETKAEATAEKDD